MVHGYFLIKPVLSLIRLLSVFVRAHLRIIYYFLILPDYLKHSFFSLDGFLDIAETGAQIAFELFPVIVVRVSDFGFFLFTAE
jgi:hypothetical protein